MESIKSKPIYTIAHLKFQIQYNDLDTKIYSELSESKSSSRFEKCFSALICYLIEYILSRLHLTMCWVIPHSYKFYFLTFVKEILRWKIKYNEVVSFNCKGLILRLMTEVTKFKRTESFCRRLFDFGYDSSFRASELLSLITGKFT